MVSTNLKKKQKHKNLTKRKFWIRMQPLLKDVTCETLHFRSWWSRCWGTSHANGFGLGHDEAIVEGCPMRRRTASIWTTTKPQIKQKQNWGRQSNTNKRKQAIMKKQKNIEPPQWSHASSGEKHGFQCEWTQPRPDGSRILGPETFGTTGVPSSAYVASGFLQLQPARLSGSSRFTLLGNLCIRLEVRNLFEQGAQCIPRSLVLVILHQHNIYLRNACRSGDELLSYKQPEM